MTAVQSFPTLQSLPKLGWSSSGSGGQSGYGGIEEGQRGTRKPFQRSNSSSSTSSDSSTSTTFTKTNSSSNPSATTDDIPISQEQQPTQSRFTRGFWAATKEEILLASRTLNGPLGAEPVSSNTASASRPSLTSQPGLKNPTPKIMQNPNQPVTNGARMGMSAPASETPALLVLLPMNGTFERKQISVPLYPEMLRIGRQTNAKTVPTPANGYFDSKVLSRQHAEVWADRSGKVWIRDVKSSNGTFVNGVRLSPESRDSEPHELRENDMLELGIDIVSEDQKSIVHHKVSAKVEHAGVPTNATSVLDLSLGDIEPGSGGGLSLPNGTMQRRMSNTSVVSSNGRSTTFSVTNGQANGYGIQRHMGAWITPVSIEQVVKRLTVSLCCV
jgi:pSer/pThr/pTyr-binding forkhead associated (FHA) protein